MEAIDERGTKNWSDKQDGIFGCIVIATEDVSIDMAIAGGDNNEDHKSNDRIFGLDDSAITAVFLRKNK